MTRISIITVCYNAASTIETTIQSVLSQRYASKEFIVIDGASKDDTMDIINRYSDRIDIIISEKDEGIPDALNKGITHATGEYLYFLSSDDVFCNDHVLADIFNAPRTADMIYGNVILKSTGRKYDGEFDLQKLLRSNICHQAQFYKSGIFAKVGNYNLRYKLLSDYDHTLRIFAESALTIQYVDIVIAIFNDKGRTSYIIDKAFWKDRKRVFIDRFRDRLSLKELATAYEMYLYYSLKDGSILKGMVVLLEMLYYSGNISYLTAAMRNLYYRFNSHARL